jgi:hypothetical protein
LLGVAKLEHGDQEGVNWFDGACQLREKHNLPAESDAAPMSGASVLLPAPEYALPALIAFFTEQAA